MPQRIPDGWEVLSCYSNYAFWWVKLFAALNGAECYPDSVTWTVRDKASGAVRKVTAQTEAEAAAKIEKSQFDPSR